MVSPNGEKGSNSAGEGGLPEIKERPALPKALTEGMMRVIVHDLRDSSDIVMDFGDFETLNEAFLLMKETEGVNNFSIVSCYNSRSSMFYAISYSELTCKIEIDPSKKYRLQDLDPDEYQKARPGMLKVFIHGVSGYPVASGGGRMCMGEFASLKDAVTRIGDYFAQYEGLTYYQCYDEKGQLAYGGRYDEMKEAAGL